MNKIHEFNTPPVIGQTDKQAAFANILRETYISKNKDEISTAYNDIFSAAEGEQQINALKENPITNLVFCETNAAKIIAIVNDLARETGGIKPDCSLLGYKSYSEYSEAFCDAYNRTYPLLEILSHDSNSKHYYTEAVKSASEACDFFNALNISNTDEFTPVTIESADLDDNFRRTSLEGITTAVWGPGIISVTTATNNLDGDYGHGNRTAVIFEADSGYIFKAEVNEKDEFSDRVSMVACGGFEQSQLIAALRLAADMLEYQAYGGITK